MYRPCYSAEHSALFFCTESISSGAAFSGARNVFVCGALQDPARMSVLLGLEPPFAPAVAVGYRRSVESIDGEEVPFMVPDLDDPHRVLSGVVWLDLTEAALEKIESLELDRALRRRIEIEVRIGELRLSAYTYVRG